jgi:hypothetical protein
MFGQKNLNNYSENCFIKQYYLSNLICRYYLFYVVGSKFGVPLTLKGWEKRKKYRKKKALLLPGVLYD